MFQLGGLLEGEEGGEHQQQHDEPGGDEEEKHQQSRAGPSGEKESWLGESGREKQLHWEHYGLNVFSNSKYLLSSDNANISHTFSSTTV